MSRRLLIALESFRRERGLNQGELAARLQVSQPHLSRVISGAASPGLKLQVRIRKLLSDAAEPSDAARDTWLEQIAAAAKRSPSFKTLVDRALDLVRKDRS